MPVNDSLAPEVVSSLTHAVLRACAAVLCL